MNIYLPCKWVTYEASMCGDWYCFGLREREATTWFVQQLFDREGVMNNAPKQVNSKLHTDLTKRRQSKVLGNYSQMAVKNDLITLDMRNRDCDPVIRISVKGYHIATVHHVGKMLTWIYFRGK